MAIIAWLVARGLPPWAAKTLFFGALAIAAAALLFGLKSCYDHSIIKQDRLEQENKGLKVEQKADEAATDERIADTNTVETQRKELRDAHTNPAVPDGLTDRQRHGCVILRQQGRDLSAYPACRGLAPGR